MPSSETDHNYYTQGHHRRPSQLSNRSLPLESAAFDAPTLTSSPPPPSRSVPPLTAYTESRPSKSSSRRPTITTNFDGRSLNHLRGPSADDASPDPAEFYRQYRDPFANTPGGLIGQGSIVVSPVEGGMTAASGRKLSQSSARSNGTAPALHPSQRPSNRSSISSAKSPLTAAKSTPTLSSSHKPRQNSLRDLVDRFNQTPDEVPPLPLPPSSKPTSRSTSRTVSPVSSSTFSRSRNASLSQHTTNTSQGGKESRQRRESRSSISSTHRREGLYEPSTVPSSASAPRSGSQRRQPSVTSNANATQSLTNLNNTPAAVPRRPLFGEITTLNTSFLAPGHGISSPQRRRGSEGSMHSPGRMFTGGFPDISPGISPSSPTAWYLGYTPSLDAINPNRPTTRPATHRRTQSDMASANKPAKSSALSASVKTMSPPPETASGGNSGSTSHRNSQSRIPVSSRRLSLNSDSGHSSSSTRANSAMGRYTVSKAIPPKGTSSLPKPTQRSTSPLRPSPTPPKNKSPGRRDVGQKPQSNPLLKANIIAPPPKKSPPLRSSRPRQPVSSATTSASRAKVVERMSSLEAQERFSKDRGRLKQPPKVLPELGKVDFAARRQRIQQAFNKSVQENERKKERVAEKRRLAQEQREQEQREALERRHAETTAAAAAQHLHVSDEEERYELANEDEESFATPMEEFPPHQRQLTIDTSNIPAHKPIPEEFHDDVDSPTLGVPSDVATVNTTLQSGVSPASEMPPLSAVTAATADTTDTADTAETDSTTFDNEPQTEIPMPGRNVLSQIMSMREPSPGSRSHSEHADDTLSEPDDKESIQIMLGETRADEISETDDRFGIHTLKVHDDPRNRLSTSSWTSSIAEGDSPNYVADGPMETIEEASPRPESSGHRSYTTADSKRTPQSWASPTFTSPHTARSTIDSSLGASVPLTQPETSLLTPGARQTYIQQILAQSPDLARQGGWDPKRVTQLYLQELARGPRQKTHHVPPPLQLQHPDSRATEKSAEHEGRDPEHLSPTLSRGRQSEDSRPSLGSSDDEPSSSPIAQKIVHRASLHHRDDWENTSPSILDWIQPEGFDHSPTDDGQLTSGPTPPPKDSAELAKEALQNFRYADEGPTLPQIDTGGSLGLAIHVQSPQENDSPTIPPPPLPTYSPPPPPGQSKPADTFEPLAAKAASPSVYNSNPPSSVFPQAEDAPMTARSSSESDEPGYATISIPDSHPSQPSAPLERPSLDQRTSSDAGPKRSASPERRRLTKRRNVIKELIDTEHSFGRDMKVVDDIYKGTSSSCLDLSAEDVKTLFCNSDMIVQFSMNFLDSLKQAAKPIYVMPKAQRYKNNRASSATAASGTTEERAPSQGLELTDEENDRQTSIGVVFGEHMARMEKVYAEYLKNHDSANKKLLSLQQNPKVNIWLKECRQWASDLTTAWDLDSLLVKPVQRVLKYPLLLTQLLESTPEDHPDYTAIDVAVREMTGVSFRINEMKKRADVVEQVINSRKRKDSDVRTGLQKAFGRRTEKLRQHVGLSDMFEDRQYNALQEKFGSNFFQLQVVMRDVEMYTADAQNFMNKFYEYVTTIEAFIDVGQSSHPEMESKWRKFRMSVKEISATAMTEHVSAVRKSVIEPMVTLLKMHDGPQRVISKRNKRLLDYARFKAMKDRGDKPDKKTAEQGDQFVALNVTLKEELPKLFSLTATLIAACLNNFIELQMAWLTIWQRKLSFAIDEHGIPEDVAQIIHHWTGDFNYTEAQVLTLGICNGSLLADAVNLVNFLTPQTTLNGDDSSSARRVGTFSTANSRTLSNDGSPTIQSNGFGKRHSGSYTNSPHSEIYQHQNLSQPQASFPSGRQRANSAVSGRGQDTPEMSYNYRTSTAATSSNPRPSTSTGRSTEPSPLLPRLSIDTPSFNNLTGDRTSPLPPFSGNSQNHLSSQTNTLPSPSPAARYSGFFSSAMPMSDSPRVQSPAIERPLGQNANILFLAASVYEFNIDRARREGGYPYLTYVAGEIFDVIGEKGELWLAKNQDDPTNQVGWIWNKHFAKLAAQ